jgi:hypothetical protein
MWIRAFLLDLISCLTDLAKPRLMRLFQQIPHLLQVPLVGAHQNNTTIACGGARVFAEFSTQF